MMKSWKTGVGDVAQRLVVAAQHHEDVSAGLRVHVTERQRDVGLGDDVRRHLARDDPAEQAVGVGHAVTLGPSLGCRVTVDEMLFLGPDALYRPDENRAGIWTEHNGPYPCVEPAKATGAKWRFHADLARYFNLAFAEEDSSI